MTMPQPEYKMPDGSACCQNCRYWIVTECRRHPPTMHGGETRGRWPVTRAFEWCGEYERKVT